MNTWTHFEAEETHPLPAVQPRENHRSRGILAAGLFALALAGGSIGGGIAGAYAAVSWLSPTSSPAEVSSSGASAIPQEGLQPVSQPPAMSPPVAANVAGEAFKKVSPSVVQVVVAGTGARSLGSGSGSGFVVDKRGYILTNQHVIEGARTVSVRFNTGTVREATVVGTDTGNDLALLKVDLPEGVPAAPLGDSETVAIGDLAIVIGSPFGLDQTLTQGIISAVHRTWAPGSGRVRRNLLQTDAPVNPGNSGGPLLNAAGQVVGITSMIESPVRGNVGVGFAIPVNTARRLLPQLEAGARLEPVWLGITGQAVDPAIARDQSLPVQEGVLVLSTVAEGPASRAGVRGGQASPDERIARGGDVIVAIDGTPVKDLGQVTEALVGRKAGDTLRLTVIRDGQRQDIQVTLQNWPST